MRGPALLFFWSQIALASDSGCIPNLQRLAARPFTETDLQEMLSKLHNQTVAGRDGTRYFIQTRDTFGRRFEPSPFVFDGKPHLKEVHPGHRPGDAASDLDELGNWWQAHHNVRIHRAADSQVIGFSDLLSVKDSLLISIAHLSREPTGSGGKVPLEQQPRHRRNGIGGKLMKMILDAIPPQTRVFLWDLEARDVALLNAAHEEASRRVKGGDSAADTTAGFNQTIEELRGLEGRQPQPKHLPPWLSSSFDDGRQLYPLWLTLLRKGGIEDLHVEVGTVEESFPRGHGGDWEMREVKTYAISGIKPGAKIMRRRNQQASLPKLTPEEVMKQIPELWDSIYFGQANFRDTLPKVLSLFDSMYEHYPIDADIPIDELAERARFYQASWGELFKFALRTGDLGFIEKRPMRSIPPRDPALREEAFDFLGKLVDRTPGSVLRVCRPHAAVLELIKTASPEWDEKVIPVLLGKLKPLFAKMAGWEPLFEIYAKDRTLPLKTRQAFRKLIDEVKQENPDREMEESLEVWLNGKRRHHPGPPDGFGKRTAGKREAPPPRPQRPEFDYYKALGVSRFSSQKEIAAAYRRIAKENHPDTAQGDPERSERFKRAAAAFEVLNDPHKRERYDRYGL